MITRRVYPIEPLAVRQTFPVDIGTVHVDGYHEVLALHRYLFECKGEDLTGEYAGSPFHSGGSEPPG
jgi:hypothetical protein